jgi:VanZ family protein
MDVARLLGTRWLPVALYLALIFVLSSIPAFHVPGTFFLKDKIAHAVEYAGLGWLVHRAVLGTWPAAGAFTRVFGSLLAIALFGVADEVYQAGTPGRDSSIFDWLADLLGASLGSLLGLARESRRVRRRR